jgi:hypothetical protein
MGTASERAGRVDRRGRSRRSWTAST